MPLIERAAPALAESECGKDAWCNLDLQLREELKENVLAVVRAMRVPTLRMCMAGHDLIEQEGIFRDSEGMQDAWQAMIDAALNSPKTTEIDA
jgi:hypothetical protein